MTRSTIRLHHWANATVIATGAVLFGMKHLLEPSDPFAVVNHPWQPDVQHLHVITAPLLVFATGMLWSHASAGLRSGSRRRWSGLTLVAAFVPMALSGYLLQVATEPAWRTTWLWTHVATSTAWSLGFLVHAGLAWARRARAAAPASPGALPDRRTA